MNGGQSFCLVGLLAALLLPMWEAEAAPGKAPGGLSRVLHIWCVFRRDVSLGPCEDLLSGLRRRFQTKVVTE